MCYGFDGRNKADSLYIQRKNIVAKVALLTNVNYHSYFDKTKLEIINRKLTEITIKHHIKFVGYIDDVRFSLDDFTQRMPDYMNAHGFHNT